MFKASARNSNRLEPKNQRVQNRIEMLFHLFYPCQNFIGRIKLTFNFQLYKKQNPMAASKLWTQNNQLKKLNSSITPNSCWLYTEQALSWDILLLNTNVFVILQRFKFLTVKLPQLYGHIKFKNFKFLQNFGSDHWVS